MTEDELMEYERECGTKSAIDLLHVCPPDKYEGDYEKTMKMLKLKERRTRKKGKPRLTYSEKATESYIAKIEQLQKELGKVQPAKCGISDTDIYWLINVALADLKKQVEAEY